MKRIEFVGGSGVGKTTLFKEIVKVKNARDSWMTVEEVRQQLAKSVKPRSKLHRLFQLFLKSNSSYLLQKPMIKRILNSYIVDVLYSIQDHYYDIADIFLQGLYKDKHVNPLMRIAKTSNFYKLLLNEIILFDYFRVEGLVVFDESIIHYSSLFSDAEKVKILFENHKKLETSVIPIGIVYCFLDKEKYLERRKNRIGEGRGTLIERTLIQKN